MRTLNLTLKVWRQDGPLDDGRFEVLDAPEVNDEMSFLEMLDLVNERLITDGKEPITFDHDCREGICGTCSLMINGQAHGPQKGTATCQLHMRKFADGDTITIEPWRATAFPSSRTSWSTGRRSTASSSPAGSSPPPPAARPTPTSSRSRRPWPTRPWTPRPASAAAPASPPARTARPSCSPAAKVAHLNLLPQGQAERYRPGREDGRHDGAVLRLLHEPRRVRGGVPEGDLDRLHRDDEQGLPEGEVQEPPLPQSILNRFGTRGSPRGAA